MDLTVVAFSVWTESTRNAEVRALVARNDDAVRACVADALTRWRDAGRLAPEADVAALATVFFATVPGLLVQSHVLGFGDWGAPLDELEALLTAAAPRT
ncbi:TetR family transcriptional regulator C-terminal domain-containing protein [Demequina lutea]|uniref:BetI-type transcriptional repressor C-terminal domain-containing protein n=1 Tax=Demequina lutea TaxID=431489 RepID=A0A7Y9ZEB3_9MICO|nr:TetR family transcriptional regulator C-terminal domain-containing protein [Demequina lutea]NYI42668.1 hypothetical protein [Demequina lutea]